MSETKRTQQEQLDRFKQLFGTRKDAIELMNSFDYAKHRSQETQTRHELAECIGKTMFDFQVGDEVELNTSLDFALLEHFTGTVVDIDGDIMLVVQDINDPYTYKRVNRCILRPVVTA